MRDNQTRSIIRKQKKRRPKNKTSFQNVVLERVLSHLRPQVSPFLHPYQQQVSVDDAVDSVVVRCIRDGQEKEQKDLVNSFF